MQSEPTNEQKVNKILCRYNEGHPAKHLLREGEDHVLVAEVLRLRAALSTHAEPAAWVYAEDLEKGDGAFGNAKGEVCMSRDGKWVNVNTPLYRAPPAPAVTVKALEWKAHNEGFGHGRMHYGTGVFGHWYGVSRVKTGCWASVHHVDGKPVHMPMAESLDLAKSAAQADYEDRVRSALASTGGEHHAE